MASPLRSEWISAMRDELNSLYFNNTWDNHIGHTTDTDSETCQWGNSKKHGIGSKWVYKAKLNTDGATRFKAKMVVRMCGFLCIVMHPEGGLGFMDKPCDHRTSTNHRIWQEFHTFLGYSTRFYEILRIMVSYGLLWLRLDFKAGFYEVPLGSVVFYLVLRTFFCILLYSFRLRAMLCYSFVKRISCHEFCL